MVFAKLSLSILLSLLLVGCMGVKTTYQDGLRVRTIEKTNWFAPSLALMEVAQCSEVKGDTLKTVVIDKEAGELTRTECEGEYRSIATIHGTQPGAMTGVFGAVIQGGAIVGGAALIGDGLKKSGDNVEQSGGGAISQSKSRSYSRSSASAVTKRGRRHYH